MRLCRLRMLLLKEPRLRMLRQLRLFHRLRSVGCLATTDRPSTWHKTALIPLWPLLPLLASNILGIHTECLVMIQVLVVMEEAWAGQVGINRDCGSNLRTRGSSSPHKAAFSSTLQATSPFSSMTNSGRSGSTCVACG